MRYPRVKRKIRIRTGFAFYVHKKLEQIRWFCQSIRFAFISRKLWVKRWSDDNKEEFAAVKAIEEENPPEFIIPSFNPSSTVLFSTDYSNYPQKLNKDVLMLFRFKIQQECQWLLNKGYTDFIVNGGDNYGMVALSELFHLKNKYYPNMNLYYSKVTHECASCITIFDIINILGTCYSGGVIFLKALSPRHFIDKVVLKTSRMSYEFGVIKTNQTLPKSMYDHYKKFFTQVNDD